jgi:hypothetical protein
VPCIMQPHVADPQVTQKLLPAGSDGVGMQRVAHLIRAHIIAAAVAFTEPQPLFPLPLTSSLEHLDHIVGHREGPT